MNYIAPRAEPLIREIPLSSLALAPENVRKTPPDPRADAELKASIAALGLLENLVVRADEPAEDGAERFAVVAGGRRLKAMQALVEDSHRGNRLAAEPCRFRSRISCPYHAWTYALDGELLVTPHVGGPGKHGNDSFDRRRHGLKAVRAAVWLDLVFVNPDGGAPPFEDHIAPLAERVQGLAEPAQIERMRPAATHGSFELEFGGNWKLVVENNLESYHLPFVHRDLNRRSRLQDHYHYYGGDLFAGQGSNLYRPGEAAAGFHRFGGWPERVSEYPTLFPNVLLGLHGDHIWSIVLFPLAPGRTREDWRIYYVGETADDPARDAARAATQEAWRKVFLEDQGVVEGMQRGRGSPAFLGGVFSGVMDEPAHHFHKWVANRLAARSGAPPEPDAVP